MERRNRLFFFAIALRLKSPYINNWENLEKTLKNEEPTPITGDREDRSAGCRSSSYGNIPVGRVWDQRKTKRFPGDGSRQKRSKIITRHLENTQLPVLSEEAASIDFEERKNWEYFWLIDPLDGTKEFINRNGEFTINIALIRRDTPVGGVIYVPSPDILYTGSIGTGVHKNEKGVLTEFARLAERIQFSDLLQRKNIIVIASRSHMNLETNAFIDRFQNATLLSRGSSLKFMQLLENKADIYPRLGPTMEWDTAAAHAILNASNRGVYHADMKSEIRYNKPDLTNPPFIAF